MPMSPKFTWRKIPMKFGEPSHRYYAGEICIGAVSYNSLKSRNDVGKDYIYRFLLPGWKGFLKSSSGNVATIGEAKVIIENIADAWFKAVSK